MPAKYLLDTDIASFAINNRFPKVRERMRQVPFLDIAISVITEAELRFGVVRRRSGPSLQFAVEGFLEHADILPWDSAVAKRYAVLRAGPELEGSPLGAMDLMIAAHALTLGRTLVTHDLGFQKVKGLKLADWTR